MTSYGMLVVETGVVGAFGASCVFFLFSSDSDSRAEVETSKRLAWRLAADVNTTRV